MPISFFGRTGYVAGGPFDLRKKAFPDSYGIKLAPEVDDPAELVVPVEDFGTPDDTKGFVRAAEDAVVRTLRGEMVYVGCYFGQGRTGTFLSVMAKLCGAAQPVEYVRDVYNKNAVETKAQEKLVENVGTFLPRIRIRFRLITGL
jgi:protein-tyrosine phosphatase